MNGKIEICNNKEDGYTAKEAMKLAIEQMKAKTAHVVSVISLGEKYWDYESILFMKMFLRFLHKNQGRVLLFAENDEALYGLEEHIAERNAKIRVVERMTMEEHGVSDDMILNRINGAEAECIIASLPAEMENAFLEKYQATLDVKIWVRIGTHLKRKKNLLWLRKFWKDIQITFGWNVTEKSRK